MASSVIDVLSPVLGLDRRLSYQQQPPFSTPLAKNVWPHDVFENRDRCGSRPGLVKAFPSGVTGPVHLLANVRVIEGIATTGTQTHFLREFDFPGSTQALEWSTPTWIARRPDCNRDFLNLLQTGTWAIMRANSPPPYEHHNEGGLIAPAFDQSVANSTNYFVELIISGDMRQAGAVVTDSGSTTGRSRIFLGMSDNAPNVFQDGILVEADHTLHILSVTQYVSGAGTPLLTGLAFPAANGPSTFRARVFTGVAGAITIECFVGGAAATIASEFILPMVGKRIGFSIGGVHQPVDNGVMWRRVDSFGVYYIGTAPSANRNVVVALGGTNAGVFVTAANAELRFEDFPHSLTLPVAHLIPNAGGRQLQAAELLGKLYIVGEDAGLWEFDPSGSGALRVVIATAGSSPSDCTAIAAWRTRLCVVSQTDTGTPSGGGGPQNISMSKVGTPLDWSFASLPVGSAVKLNTTGIDTGKLGEPINCLIAHSNDYLLIGCLNSLYLLRGDPTYGGQIDRLSASVGIVAPQAYARGPDGETVFLSNDGIYAIPPQFGAFPESVSRERLPKELRDIDVKNYRILMAYDVYNRGVFIGQTPIMGSGGKYFWLDWVNRGFWPLEFDPSHEPTSLVFRNADAASAQRLLFGCRDGHIRTMNDAAFTDDGLPERTPELLIGPIALGGGGYFDGMLVEVVGQLAEGSSEVNCDLLIGTSAENAYRATPRPIGTLRGGKNRTFRPQIRGNACIIRLHGAPPWALEMMTVARERLGKQRL